MGGIGSILFLIVALIIGFEVIMVLSLSLHSMGREISGLLTIVGSLLMFSYTCRKRTH
jgi:hypothetical protein